MEMTAAEAISSINHERDTPLLQTDEASVAFGVILRALMDATMPSPQTEVIDDERVEVRADARAFLLNQQEECTLHFWCGVLGLPVAAVDRLAHTLEARGWKRPEGGFQLKGLQAHGV